jgi:hypothetical protein
LSRGFPPKKPGALVSSIAPLAKEANFMELFKNPPFAKGGFGRISMAWLLPGEGDFWFDQ